MLIQTPEPSFFETVGKAFEFDAFLPWHFWFLFALLMGILEMFTPGFVLACLGAGGLGAALADICGWHDLTLQIGVFAGVTFLSFFSLRPLLLRVLQEEAPPTNIDALIGQSGRVTSACPAGGVGAVRIGAEEWRAQAASGGPLLEGDTVGVVRVDGNRLIVE